MSSLCHFSVSCHTVAVLMCWWYSLPSLSPGSKPHGRPCCADTPETSVRGLWFSFVLITQQRQRKSRSSSASARRTVAAPAWVPPSQGAHG